MILHSLSLKDFRGVKSESITFADRGVTIISGPNEIGKSSFLLALDMLLSDPDSSTKSSIKSIQPVGRDVGPEASMTFSSGPYELILTKRWLKAPSTTLEISRPAKSVLNGRQAHDKVRDILNETLDETLWKALRYHQGALHLAYAPTQSETLGAALDFTAGSSSRQDGEGAGELIALVRAERSKYLTETGRPVRNRTEWAAQLQELERQIEEVEEALARSEGQSEELQRLRATIPERERELNEHQSKLDSYEAAWNQFVELKHQVNLAGLSVTIAQSNRQSAREAEQDREALKTKVHLSTTELAELERSRESLAEQASEADAHLAKAAEDVELKRSLLAPLVERKEGLERSRDELYRHQEATRLHELIQQVIELHNSQRASEKFLEECKLTPDDVKEFEELERNVDTSRARLDVELPHVRVSAQQPFELGFNDQTIDLGVGDTFSPPAEDPLLIMIGDLAIVEVAGGSNLSDLHDAYNRALIEVEEFRSAHLVPSDQSSVHVQKILRDRDHHLERLEQIHSRLTQIYSTSEYPSLSKMEETLQTLQLTAPTQGGQLHLDGSHREALDEVLANLTALQELCAQAQNALEESRIKLTATQHRSVERSTELRTINERVEAARSNAHNLQEELSQAREHASDAALQSAVRDMSDALEDCERSSQSLKEQLDAPQFQLLDEMRENESLRIQELKADRVQINQRIDRLVGELHVLGESGLYSKLEQLRHEHERLSIRITTTDRQARAADKLYQSLLYYQHEDRQRLIEPLTHAISTLGSAVYSDRFAVDLDHDTLNIATRTLNGTTLSLDQLSIGAQEQVALIYMLAVAQIIGSSPTNVDQAAGAPIILDDALGNSDRTRLDQLGALFRMVAPTSQIIIFTCYPERFSSVGGALRIELPTSAF